MYSALAGACKKRIAQNNGVDGRSGRFYVHGNKKASTQRGGENVKYLVVKANVDAEGILKDLALIEEKATELERMASVIRRRIEISGESTNSADSPES